MEIPVCQRCNAAYGEIEQDVLLRVGLCINPLAMATAGIVPKVLESLDSSKAIDERDRHARQAKRDEIMNQMLVGSKIPNVGVYPNLGNRWNLPIHTLSAITIPAESVHKIFEKVTRGILYKRHGKFVEPPYSILTRPLEEADAGEFNTLLERFGTRHARGPGIVVTYAYNPEDNISSIYKFEVWQSFIYYAAVSMNS